MNYYKATRPDGTDFHTGTVNYARALETGETLRHPAAKRVRDEPETYFSVSIAPADCTGMQWPCRLFRVVPVGRTLTATNLPNKRACSALRVVEELPAWQALGPNGEAVAAHLERCQHITAAEATQLRAAIAGAIAGTWASARGSAWASAWAGAWASARGSAIAGAWASAGASARGSAWASARTSAGDSAGVAALAIVVRDLITPEQFDLLYGPWASVMEAAQ